MKVRNRCIMVRNGELKCFYLKFHSISCQDIRRYEFKFATSVHVYTRHLFTVLIPYLIKF